MEKVKITQPAVQQQMPKKANQPMIQPVNQPMNQPVEMAHHHKPNIAAQPAAKKISKAHCESLMYRYVEVQAVDGYCYDGIVEHVDEEWICLAVPGSVEPMRAFFPHPPFGGPFFPYRPRRFNRLVLPLAGIAAISLLPYYW